MALPFEVVDLSCARDTGEPASIPPPSPSTPKATCATLWGGPAAARVDAGREAPAWPRDLRPSAGLQRGQISSQSGDSSARDGQQGLAVARATLEMNALDVRPGRDSHRGRLSCARRRRPSIRPTATAGARSSAPAPRRAPWSDRCVGITSVECDEGRSASADVGGHPRLCVPSISCSLRVHLALAAAHSACESTRGGSPHG